MDRVAESSAPAELLRWIAYERDAAWTAKLAIVRARRREDIAHFGACLREHDRHTEELGKLLRATSPALEIPTEPSFVTRDAFVVGAVDDPATLLEAIDSLEAGRIERYEQRRGRTPGARLDEILDRHLADARARRASLRRLGARRQVAA
jgi:hypothetical protein